MFLKDLIIYALKIRPFDPTIFQTILRHWGSSVKAVFPQYCILLQAKIVLVCHTELQMQATASALSLSRGTAYNAAIVSQAKYITGCKKYITFVPLRLSKGFGMQRDISPTYEIFILEQTQLESLAPGNGKQTDSITLILLADALYTLRHTR